MLKTLHAHLRYFSYVMRHKWYVFEACLKYDVPIWRALIHDWTKFLPAEWPGYVNHDFTSKVEDLAFDYAWNHYQKVNKHHWNYWVLVDSPTKIRALEMPETYIREMVADWYGAGMAMNKPDIIGWYESGKEHRLLHPETRKKVEQLLYETNW